MKYAGIESLKREPYTNKGMCAHSRVDRSISVQGMIHHLLIVTIRGHFALKRMMNMW